jgi:glycosyltransferase involved in cell wall biosynthesis
VALLEALAVGRPVVSTAVGAAPELLESGAGRISPREPQAFASRILEVDSQYASFQQGAARVGREVVGRWTYPAVAARLVELYRELGVRG